jgi:hypothetical protein
MMYRLEMNANLVRSPGLRHRLHYRMRANVTDAFPLRYRVPQYTARFRLS